MKLPLNLLANCYIDYSLRRSQKKEIYYIEIKGDNLGFFALMRTVLNFCCYADENGFMPYIKYSRDILYAEKNFFLQTYNTFEYYFKQPFVSKWHFGLKKNNIIKCRGEHAEQIELKYNLKPISYVVEETYIDRMSDIYRKYIQLNDETFDRLEKNIRKILQNKKTLGIHIRGTDFYKEFNNHPVPVTVSEYVEFIEKAVKEQNYEQVFIATDDIRALREIKKKLQVPITYYRNNLRTKNNKSVAFERNGRKHNNYLLGLEVLQDVYTLVACNGFLGCLSQIDIFVQIIKRSKEQKFDFLQIINKGIVNNNRQCWEPTK